VKAGHNVIAIGRRGLTRTDYAGHPLRAERPFRVLCENEETFEAEVVLDASGGLTVPRPIGPGGLPARGESRLARRPIRTLGDLAANRDQMRGRRILVIGDGHSAANAIGVLDELAQEDPSTRVTWAVRSANRRPCEEVANDPLPERRAVVERANALAEAPPPFLTVERRAMIDSVAQTNGHATITLTANRVVEADFIAAFTGYRPDGGFLSELAVEISPVSEGGARLYRAISSVTDCLSVPQVKPDDLASGERFLELIRGFGFERPRLKVLSLFRIGAEESRTRSYEEWERLEMDSLTAEEAATLQCSSCRMVTSKGVYVCPILIEEPAARMGESLQETVRSFTLGHAACHTCFVDGVTCTT
jgi:hypothetical protein